MTTKLVTAVLMTADEMTPRLFDLDFQLLADAVLSIIAVFVLFLAMSYFLFNPAREFLKKRQDKIRNELEEARVSQEEAAALKRNMRTSWQTSIKKLMKSSALPERRQRPMKPVLLRRPGLKPPEL